ncbi:hypothetical protein [Thermocoleostomius sinensis]|uniref:Uncharacterized protein n=1 Tax=Thermocoleostomius sinensis A174 TaxID=2016057 RepID=A0A9E8ZHQ0_9CYAN|nr:hypothetical protein [Thermocoleostomius sinensis]WAL62009.1 hypothetical protein OXH18_08495 [Thermocoleostomius sinensis A174]
MVLYISEALRRSTPYRAASAIEEHRRVIGISLIAGSIGFWCMQLGTEKQTYTVTLPPNSFSTGETHTAEKYIDFPKEDFKMGTVVEPIHTIETSRGDRLAFRPTQYPLTVDTKLAGFLLRQSQILVNVVEVWINGEKQGYFDFYQDRFVTSNTENAKQQTIADLRFER